MVRYRQAPLSLEGALEMTLKTCLLLLLSALSVTPPASAAVSLSPVVPLSGGAAPLSPGTLPGLGSSLEGGWARGARLFDGSLAAPEDPFEALPSLPAPALPPAA